MKEKDITEKILLGYNDVFADIINGAVFGGENVVKDCELTDASPLTQFKDDGNIHHEQVRDIAKLWEKDKVIFSFIGIENQTKPDKDMILRVISYDGASYRSQLGNDNIYPVFTIVIYWGKCEWKVPTNLKSRMECPSRLDKMISDYSFQLIDIARLTDKDIKRYKSDFRVIAEFIAKQSDYKPGLEEISHPEELLDFLGIVAGDDRFLSIKSEIEDIRKEGRSINMCELLDKIESRGIEKGRVEGRLEGKFEGQRLGKLEGIELATFDIARNLKNSNVETSIIVKATGLTKEQIEKL